MSETSEEAPRLTGDERLAFEQARRDDCTRIVRDASFQNLIEIARVICSEFDRVALGDTPNAEYKRFAGDMLTLVGERFSAMLGKIISPSMRLTALRESGGWISADRWFLRGKAYDEYGAYASLGDVFAILAKVATEEPYRRRKPLSDELALDLKVHHDHLVALKLE